VEAWHCLRTQTATSALVDVNNVMGNVTSRLPVEPFMIRLVSVTTFITTDVHYRLGHGAPARDTQKMPLRARRMFLDFKPHWSFGNSGSMTLHSKSVRS